MRWGKWVLDPQTLCLTHDDTGYGIDVERVGSSAAILDWIFQIQTKPWADAGSMYDLLRALADVLRPQANYCSNEQDLRADGGHLAREYISRKSGAV